MDPADRSTDRALQRPSRRRLLAAGGVSLATALAGCAGLRTRTLARPDARDEDDEAHLIYADDGDRVAEVSLLERWNVDAGHPPYGIRLHVWHAEDTRLERLRYELRPQGVGHPPAFSLTRPGGSPWEPITFARGDDPGTTVLEVPELGVQGRGSVTFDLLVEPWNDDAFDLRVDVEATLESEGYLGRDYELEGALVRTLPGYDDFENE